METEGVRSGVYFELLDQSKSEPSYLISLGKVKRPDEDLGEGSKHEFRVKVSSQGKIVLIGDSLPNITLDETTGVLSYSDDDEDGVGFPHVSEMYLRPDGVLMSGDA